MNTESASIARWLKHEGDTVAVGDVLAEVETDKTSIELEADTAGTLRRLLVAEGGQIAVSQPVALIGTPDEDLSTFVSGAATPVPNAPRFVERVYQAWR